MLLIAAGLVLSPIYFADSVLADNKGHGNKAGKIDPKMSQAKPERASKAKSNYDLDAVARQVQRRHGGRVLRVDPDRANKALDQLRVKLLTNDGRVRILLVNPTDLE